MQEPLRKIYLVFLLVAALAAAAVTYFMYKSNHPYEFVHAQEPAFQKYDFLYLYHDLNHDGVSERIYIENYPERKEFDMKVYVPSAYELVLRDQYNFKEKIAYMFLNYKDINGDGADEIFLFSYDNKYLYLSIIDYFNNKKLLDRHPVLEADKDNPHSSWDIDDLNSVFSDINGDGCEEFIFTINSGYSLRPRGIYAFDLKTKKIIQKKNYHATVYNIFTYDLNQDGEEEFVLTSSATDNFQTDINYTDQKCWLIVLDKNFKEFFPAKSFGAAYSSIRGYTVQKSGENLLLGILIVRGMPSSLFLFDKAGNTIDSLRLPAIIAKVVVNHLDPEMNIYIKFHNLPGTYVYNLDFQLTQTIKWNQTKLWPFWDVVNIGLFNESVLYGSEPGGFKLSNKNMETLAFFPWKRDGLRKLTLRYVNRDTNPQLVLCTLRHFYVLELRQNKLYTYLPFLFFIFLAGIYGLLLLLNILINKIHIYFSYFLFSLKDSDNAIILLNHKGYILSINHKVENTLQLEQKIKPKQFFKESLGKRTDICNVIDDALIKRVQIKKEISFEDAHSSFIGEVSVTPFFSFFKFANAYLVEIKDSTEQVLADRQSNWQRTVRKMVHDIKNPLGGVQLKLQTIYLRLTEQYPEAAEVLQNDLETANAEIKRIRNISKDFLKFSDLDTPHFEPLDIKILMNRILQHFVSFQNEFMTIEITYGSSMPDHILLDERQTELLMHILIENAIDALKGKGKIDINLNLVQKLPDTKIKELEIEVKDNGPGIPVEFQDKIFEPHFSLKKEGTGMGLVFAKHIVQQHGGSIDFKSSIGTSFVVTLPLTIDYFQLSIDY